MSAAPSAITVALADRYAIERELGQGGMATVYLADDRKHQRKVAIKVLKAELAAVLGAERFVQEIKTTAALSHPHILPLFDSGEAGGFLYYVMPFIEGETIREKLNRETQFGVDEAVKIATEVADALDYAHRHGVIHRDIKPENILLHDGRPMVMDFGIALAVSAAAGGRMTETGLSLGTPHYMSPEQATAEKEITARSDVYSLGSVLYEMLAGVPPHEGGSAQQVIMRIIADTPRPVAELRKTTPPNVSAALAKALEKLPADRFESAKAFADALTHREFSYSAAHGGTGVYRPPSGVLATGAWLRDARSKVVAGTALALGAALAWSTLAPGPAAETIANRPEYRLVLVDSILGGFAWPVIGRDGSVWIAGPGTDADGKRQFRVRRPGATVWSNLTRETLWGAGSFAVSPDGRRAAFARVTPAGAEVRVLSAESGEETLLATIAGRPGAWVTDWSDDGFVYVTAFLPTGMIGALNLRIPETGSARRDTIPLPARPDVSSCCAETLPGSDVLLYSEVVPGGAIGATSARVMAFRPRTRDTVLVAGGAVFSWSPTGHVLVGREGGFVEAVPFDPKALRVTGPSRQVLSGVSGLGPVIQFAGSRTGALAYASGPVGDNSGAARREVRWRGLDGTSERIALPVTDHNDGAVSPDGARIAYVREGRIWIFDFRSGRNAPLSADTLGADEHDPLWSPDGRRLAFRSRRAGMGADQGDLFVQPADGSGPAVRAGGTPGIDAPRQWLGDSAVLFTANLPGGTQRDMYMVVVNRAGSEKALLESSFNESPIAVDPSGRWISYVSNVDGADELYVRRFPSLENPVRVAQPGEGWADVIGRAAWSADGRSVYYESAQDSLIRVALDLSGDRARVVSQSAVLALGRGHVQFADRNPKTGRLLEWTVAGVDSLPERPKLILIVNFDQVIRRIMREGR
ncbi:MAG: protein kinase [Gemmatimonadota bacterium]|nr:protein kinase [Gemmatimonadota bacterium]